MGCIYFIKRRNPEWCLILGKKRIISHGISFTACYNHQAGDNKDKGIVFHKNQIELMEFFLDTKIKWKNKTKT